MDLHDAISAHLQWKQHLQGAVSGTDPDPMDPVLAEADNRCPLGKWIYRELQKPSTRQEISELLAEHATFHREAARVLALAKEGRTLEARTSIESGAFHIASTRTLGAIIRHLRTRMGRA